MNMTGENLRFKWGEYSPYTSLDYMVRKGQQQRADTFFSHMSVIQYNLPNHMH